MDGSSAVNVVIRDSAVADLLALVNKTLLGRRNALDLCDLLLDVVNRVCCSNVDGNRLSAQSLNRDLHPVFMSMCVDGRGGVRGNVAPLFVPS